MQAIAFVEILWKFVVIAKVSAYFYVDFFFSFTCPMIYFHSGGLSFLVHRNW